MTKPKSKSESTPEPEPTLEPREPRALSNEYHKARKQLMLWAAILFIWELVGIDLEKGKDAGGNAGAIIGALKSPQAVPWALVILVLYFAFKLRTEWRQCHVTRRQVVEAKQDYYLAFIVGGAACGLYIGQAVSHAQLADRLQSKRGLIAVILTTVFGAIWLASGWRLYQVIKAWRNEKGVNWLLVAQSSFGILTMVFYGSPLPRLTTHKLSLNARWILVMILEVTGAILFLSPMVYSLRRRRIAPRSKL
ncbi:MAG TPA: hypothetical protein VE969_08515 [Pyrinomonadaceae bacterium]|nr:hypothetical protein [Pyrinomonadaceae bacterium]